MVEWNINTLQWRKAQISIKTAPVVGLLAKYTLLVFFCFCFFFLVGCFFCLFVWLFSHQKIQCPKGNTMLPQLFWRGTTKRNFIFQYSYYNIYRYCTFPEKQIFQYSNLPEWKTTLTLIALSYISKNFTTK